MNMNRLSLSVRAALLATAASLVMPAMAEVAPPPVAVTAVTAVTAAATVDQPVGDDEDTPGEYDDDEIVVTGTRLAGQLDTDFAPEAELDEAAVASYGVSSIEELLEALEPQTRSGRGRGGGRPVIGSDEATSEHQPLMRRSYAVSWW